MSDKAQDQASAGFTLIEVLVALIVLGLAFGLAFNVLSEAPYGAAISRRQEAAVAVAQGVLERVGRDLPFTDGESSGDAGGYHWRVDVSEGPGADQAYVRQNVLKTVTVVVLWEQLRFERNVRLTTLRLAPKG